MQSRELSQEILLMPNDFPRIVMSGLCVACCWVWHAAQTTGMDERAARHELEAQDEVLIGAGSVLGGRNKTVI